MARTDPFPVPAADSETLAPAQLTLAWHSASLLLRFPDTALIGQLEAIHRVSHRLPDSVGGPLRSTIVHLEEGLTGLTGLQEEYRDTFHLPGRRSLLETASPWSHLCEVLERAGTVDRQLGRQLLLDHRTTLDQLRTTLARTGSGWTGAVTAVSNTLARHGGTDDPASRFDT